MNKPTAPVAAQAPSTPVGSSRWSLLVQPELRERWLAGLLLLAFAAGGFALWRQVRAFVLARSDYRLSLDEVEITPTPAWVQVDLKAEVLEGSDLVRNASILDDDLAPRLHAAFAAHPWVEKVDSVAKRHPARVDVDLVYRRPVCMVELPSGYSGVYPIDRHGVVLPSKDFTPAYAQQFPRLTGVSTLPAGKVGEAWSDPCVASGAKVAAALLGSWRTLKLRQIRPAAAAGPPEAGCTFELVTEKGTIVIWGLAPGDSASGEPTVEEKLAALSEALAVPSSQEKSQVIDLRRPSNTAKAPRTARQPDKDASTF